MYVNHETSGFLSFMIVGIRFWCFRRQAHILLFLLPMQGKRNSNIPLPLELELYISVYIIAWSSFVNPVLPVQIDVLSGRSSGHIGTRTSWLALREYWGSQRLLPHQWIEKLEHSMCHDHFASSISVQNCRAHPK
uniref:Putative ovule protein n=1 Tax=Solanum chacoense TaxID=4108 RepID=A0A0V0H7L5_SOLCH